MSRTGLKLLRPLLIVLVFICLLAAAVFFYYQFAISRKNFGGQAEADFVVAPGQKVYEIAENLRKERLINSATAFKIYVRLNNLGAKLQAGFYRLPRNLSLREVVDILRVGKFDLKLTFPEGWRREEMAYYASQKLARDGSFYQDFLEESQDLEGYLFPETYIVPKEITARELIRVMRETFDKKYREVSQGIVGPALPVKDVLTVASIVEREAKRDEDRPIIAGILLKRLEASWPLEADATVQYATAARKLSTVAYEELKDFEFWPKTITLDDLKVDSPFNTRKRTGLPPSPICNPGLASIEAVLKSVETPYWFYLNDEVGATHFAKTLPEHNANVERFLRP